MISYNSISHKKCDVVIGKYSKKRILFLTQIFKDKNYVKRKWTEEKYEEIFIPLLWCFNILKVVLNSIPLMSMTRKVHFCWCIASKRSLCCFTFRETSSSKETLVKWTTCFMLAHQTHLSYFSITQKLLHDYFFLKLYLEFWEFQ